MEDVTPILETAKGITDYGALAIMGACFILISVVGQWTIFKWFKSIIDQMINNNSCTMDDLLVETKTQNEQLADIAEGLRQKTLAEIKDISKTCFDLSVERVCRIIKRVKEENNIADNEATKAKVTMLLTNLHDDRNSRFDNHHYHNKPLSAYTTYEWIEWVRDVVLKEVYAQTQNNNRAYTNVNAVYDRIKIDFYHRLTN
ncbi:MAG: hypothetical protein II304_15495 [Bacteroidales bacterium]|nr:hypothetical protein [Bacteroidales bacterium]